MLRITRKRSKSPTYPPDQRLEEDLILEGSKVTFDIGVWRSSAHLYITVDGEVTEIDYYDHMITVEEV
jgi:hypothetical protein